jgi:uncharacterized protein YkwD
MRTVLFSIFVCCLLAVHAADPLPKAGLNKELILQLINNVRKKGCQCGDTYYPPVAPLTWNALLEKAALVHSTEMVEKKYFSHISSDGYGAGDRITAAGYNWKSYAENIGMGYRDEKEMVDGWLKSPGHCKNIMSAQYREMGVAKVNDYWTQDFGSK